MYGDRFNRLDSLRGREETVRRSISGSTIHPKSSAGIATEIEKKEPSNHGWPFYEMEILGQAGYLLEIIIIIIKIPL